MGAPFWDLSPGTGEDFSDFAPGAEGPLYASNPWDLVKLQGLRLPGICDLQIPDFDRRVQNKKANGADGSTPTMRGLDDAKIEITVKVWTKDQFDLMNRILPVIFPLPGANPTKLNAMDVAHPNTTALQIKSLVIRGITGWLPGPERSSKIIRLKCEQYTKANPKKKATKTVTGPAATTQNFTPAEGEGHNTPPPPSSTDGGPVPNFQPAGGNF